MLLKLGVAKQNVGREFNVNKNNTVEPWYFRNAQLY